MSRFCNDYDIEYPEHWWRIDLERALNSGRGQRLLREVEAALLALPNHELAHGYIVERKAWHDDDTIEVGNVCAVGAYAVYKAVQAGATQEQALLDLDEQWGGERDEWETEELGRSLGLAKTVARHLAWLNDEQCDGLSPAARWTAVLTWVRNQIRD